MSAGCGVDGLIVGFSATADCPSRHLGKDVGSFQCILLKILVEIIQVDSHVVIQLVLYDVRLYLHSIPLKLSLHCNNICSIEHSIYSANLNTQFVLQGAEAQ